MAEPVDTSRLGFWRRQDGSLEAFKLLYGSPDIAPKFKFDPGVSGRLIDGMQRFGIALQRLTPTLEPLAEVMRWHAMQEMTDAARAEREKFPSRWAWIMQRR